MVGLKMMFVNSFAINIANQTGFISKFIAIGTRIEQ